MLSVCLSVCRRRDSGEEKDALRSSEILISVKHFQLSNPTFLCCGMSSLYPEGWALIGCLKRTNTRLHMPAEDLFWADSSFPLSAG